MNLAERIEKSLKEEEVKREEKRSFRDLRDFYVTMKKEGVVIKQEYTLPLIDTIGRPISRNRSKVKFVTNAAERLKGNREGAEHSPAPDIGS